jgi:hypothetical protein
MLPASYAEGVFSNGCGNYKKPAVREIGFLDLVVDLVAIKGMAGTGIRNLQIKWTPRSRLEFVMARSEQNFVDGSVS